MCVSVRFVSVCLYVCVVMSVHLIYLMFVHNIQKGLLRFDCTLPSI